MRPEESIVVWPICELSRAARTWRTGLTSASWHITRSSVNWQRGFTPPRPMSGARVYGEVYDELFRRVPDHPQLAIDPAQRDREVSQKLRFVSRFLDHHSCLMEIGAGTAPSHARCACDPPVHRCGCVAGHRIGRAEDGLRAGRTAVSSSRGTIAGVRCAPSLIATMRREIR
jgi:hypothetical protein